MGEKLERAQDDLLRKVKLSILLDVHRIENCLVPSQNGCEE